MRTRASSCSPTRVCSMSARASCDGARGGELGVAVARHADAAVDGATPAGRHPRDVGDQREGRVRARHVVEAGVDQVVAQPGDARGEPVERAVAEVQVLVDGDHRATVATRRALRQVGAAASQRVCDVGVSRATATRASTSLGVRERTQVRNPVRCPLAPGKGPTAMFKRILAAVFTVLLLSIGLTTSAAAATGGTERPFRATATGQIHYDFTNPQGCPASGFPDTPPVHEHVDRRGPGHPPGRLQRECHALRVLGPVLRRPDDPHGRQR